MVVVYQGDGDGVLICKLTRSLRHVSCQFFVFFFRRKENIKTSFVLLRFSYYFFIIDFRFLLLIFCCVRKKNRNLAENVLDFLTLTLTLILFEINTPNSVKVFNPEIRFEYGFLSAVNQFSFFSFDLFLIFIIIDFFKKTKLKDLITRPTIGDFV